MDKIETKRTVLRRQVPSDFDSIRELEMNPLIMKFTPSKVPQTEEQTRIRFEGQMAKQASLEPFGIWVADLKEDKALVGWFMLMVTEKSQLEIGFMLNQKHWNKGLTTEISKALIDFVKTQKDFDAIVAKTTMDNVVSIHTLKKLGFENTGTAIVPDRHTGDPVQVQTFKFNLLS